MTANTQSSILIVEPGEISIASVDAGKYILKIANGPVLRQTDMKNLPVDVIVQRDGQNLVLVYSDGTKLVFEGFYADEAIEIQIPADGADTIIVDSSDLGVNVSGVAGADNSRQLLAVRGDVADLSSMASQDAALSVTMEQVFADQALQTGDMALWLGDGVNVYAAPSAGSGATLVGLGGAGLAYFSQLSTAVETFTYSFLVMAGPLVRAGAQVVKVYDKDGNSLGPAKYDEATGKYVFSSETPYTGPIIAVLEDATKGADDYVSEYSGKTEDLPDVMIVVANINAGESDVSLVLTPLTDIAAQKLGVSYDTKKKELGLPEKGITSDEVAATNKEVGKAFKLGDDFDVSKQDTIVPLVDTANNKNTDYDAYGYTLALLEGAYRDAKAEAEARDETLTQENFLKSFADGIVNGALSADNASLLGQGADAVEANNDNIAEEDLTGSVSDRFELAKETSPVGKAMDVIVNYVLDSGVNRAPLASDFTAAKITIPAGMDLDTLKDAISSYYNNKGGNQSDVVSKATAKAAIDAPSEIQSIVDALAAGVPTIGVTIDSISQDTGSSSTDFITKDNDGLTVTVKLDNALPSYQFVQYSIDGGRTWNDLAVSTSTQQTFTAAITSTSTVQVRVADILGKVGSVSSQPVTIDTDAPVFTNAANTATVTINGPAETVVYDASATDNGGAADAGITYSLSGTDAGLFTIDSATGKVTYKVSPTSEGDNDITITAKDTAGNTSTQDVTITVADKPTVTISSDVSGTAAGDVTFTFTFSESVSDFTIGDIALTGGVAGSLTGSGKTYQLLVTPTANINTGNITVNVAADAATNTSGIGIAAASEFTQAYDTAAPTVSSVVISGAESDGTTAKSNTLVAGDKILVTVAMSENTTVAGTPIYTVEVGGASKTASYVSGSGTDTLVFSYTVTGGDADAAGGVTAFANALSGGTLTDAAGNNADVSVSAVGASSNTVTVDTDAPVFTNAANTATVTINGPAETVVYDASATDNGGAADAGITYSLSGTDAGLFTIDSATGKVTYKVSPTSEGDNDITITAKDTAGNTSAQDVTITVADKPTVTISSDVSGTAAGDVTFTFTFSESVSDFTIGDIALTGGVAGSLTGSGKTYQLLVTPTANINTGNITVNVAADAATNTSGIGIAAASEFTQAYDTAAPTVSSVVISGAESDGTTAKSNTLVAGDKILVTVAMSENTTVAGTPIYTVEVGGASKTASYVSGSGTDTLVFSYTVTGGDADAAGGVTAFANALSGGTLTDAAGNNADVSVSAVAASSNTVTVDTDAPVFTNAANTATVTINGPAETVVYDASATDNGGAADAGITYSLSGTDAGLFTIDSATGKVTYKVSPTSEGDNDITITAKDTAGNTNTQNVTITVADKPTVTISSDVSGTAAGDVTFTFTFSESVSDFTIGDITLTGGVAGSLTGSGKTYQLVVTPTANINTGNITVNVAADAATNTSGIGIAAASEFTQAYDTAAPTVSSVVISGAESDGTTAKSNTLVAGDKILVTVAMSENTTVAGTPIYTVEVGGASKTASYVSGSGTDTLVFSYTVTGGDADAAGGVTAFANALSGGTLTDAAGNNADVSVSAVGASSNTVTVDGIAPVFSTADTATVAINTSTTTVVYDASATDNGGAADAGITYSLSGTDAGLFTIDSATGKVTYKVSPTSEGDNVITITAKDTAGNTSTQKVTITVADKPTVTISSDASGTATGDVTFTFTFSEAVSDFTIGDIALTGGAAGSLTDSSGSGKTYELVVTPTANTNAGNITVNVAADAATNTSGIGIAAANEFTQAYDTAAPTVSSVVISGAAGSDGAAKSNTLVAGDKILVTVTMSENTTVTGTPTYTVDVGGVNKDASYVPGSDTDTLVFSYTVTSGDADAGGGVTAKANALALSGGTLTDAAGNNADVSVSAVGASSNTVTVDGIAPVFSTADTATVAINTSTTTVVYDASATDNGGAADAGITYSLSGTDAGLFTIDSATGKVTYKVSPTSEGDNVITITAKDTAGNTSTQKVTITVADKPTVTISSDASGTATGDVTFTFTFSEAVSDFTIGDIALTGGAAGSLTDSSGSGKTYELVVTPTANTNAGNITVNVAADAATNTSGIGIAAANEFTQAYDTAAPTVNSVVISGAESDGTTAKSNTLVAGDKILVTVAMSEDTIVTGTPRYIVELGDSYKAASYVSGSGTDTLVFSYTVTSGDADAAGGVVTAAASSLVLSGDTLTDAAGNNADVSVSAEAASSNTVTVDGIAPAFSSPADTATVAINTSTTTVVYDASATDNGGAVDAGITYSLSGTDAGLFTIDSATGKVTYKVSPTSEGDNVITITAKDTAGNTSTQDVTITVANKPTVTISSDASGTATGDVTFTFTFSESVSDFTIGDIALTGGVAGSLTGSGKTYELVVTPTANTNAGNITVNVAADAATNTSGIGIAAANEFTQAYDTAAPTVSSVVISGAAGSDGAAKSYTLVAGDKILVTVTMSENTTVTGTPTYTVDVGGVNKDASYVSGSDTDTLVFSYTVTSGDADAAGGVTADTNALALSGGTLTDAAGNAADVSVSAVAASSNTVTVDGIAPTVSSVVISGAESDGTTAKSNTLVAGDKILVTVAMSEHTTLGGTPIYTVDVGGVSKVASYVPSSGTDPLVFSYTVTSGDADAGGGVTAAADALALSGGVLIDAAGNNADVSVSAVSASSNGITVDGIAPAFSSPDDTATVAINTSTATVVYDASATDNGGAVDAGITYSLSGTDAGLFTIDSATGKVTYKVSPTSEGDNVITITAKDTAGNTSTQDVTITVANKPTVTISSDASGTATGDVTFTFTFSESVSDFTIGDIALTGGVAGSLTGSGKTYELVVTPTANTNAGNITVNVAADAATNTSGIGIAAASEFTQAYDTAAPTVNSVVISGAESDGTTAKSNTLVAGDKILVTVAMSEDTIVAGTPTYTVDVGGVSKVASYVSGSGTDTLVFSYTVTSGDADAAGGVTAAANALALSGGTLTDAAANAAVVSVSAVAASSNTVTVDGIAPVFSSTTDTATVAINTSTTTVVYDASATDNGGAVDAGITYSLSGTNENLFKIDSATGKVTYKASPTSTGDNDITITATDAAGNTSTQDVTITVANKPTVTITSDASGTATGDVIFTFTFSEAVSVVSGFSVLDIALTGGRAGALTDHMGSRTTYELVVTPTANTNAGNITVNVAADAVTTTSGIGIAAASEFTQAYDTAAPTVNSVVISGAESDGTTAKSNTLVAGDKILVTVAMSEDTIVVGTPTYTVDVGGASKAASYVSGSGTDTLVFSYTVTSGDADAAGGVTAAANALALSGGTLTDAAGHNADVSVSAVAASSNGITVDTAALTVESVVISGAESDGATANTDTLVAGDKILVTVTMSKNTTVAGTPTYTVDVGGASKAASYVSGSGTETLVFSYTVTSGDADAAGGVTAAADALALSGGTLTDAAGNNADVSVSAVAASSNSITVDTAAPTVNSVVISGAESDGTTANSNTLVAGDKILVTVTMSEDTTVAGAPTYTVDVGGASKAASYVSGSGSDTLVFSYTVTSNDADAAGGVTADANALALSGGTLTDAAGNNADVSVSAVAASSNTVTVDGIAPTVSSVDISGAESDGTTANSNTLVAGDKILVTVTMSENTIVAGTPTYTVDVGGASKAASYVSGSGTETLVFSYTVTSDDADAAGGVTADANALALSGGILTDAAGNNADVSVSAVAASSNSVTVATDVPPSILTVTDDTTAAVSSTSVIYTLTFDVGVDSATFDASDIKLIDAVDAVIDLTDWTIGAPQEVSGSFGKQWTVSVTPSGGLNVIDVTAVSLRLEAGSVASKNGYTLVSQFTQDSSTQSFDTTPPSAPTLTLNTDTGSESDDGITNDGLMNVSGLDANLDSWEYTVDGGGNWTTVSDSTVTSFTLSAGTYVANQIQVRQVDSAGLLSGITRYTSALTIDTSIAAPTLSPADDGNISASSNLVLTFAENVSAVAGKNIVIIDSISGLTVETITADSTQVTIDSTSGIVTINPTDTNLIAGNSYFIEVAAGAFVDVAGNAIAANNEWNVNVYPISSTIAVSGDNKVNNAENTATITVEVTVAASSAILSDLDVANFTVTAQDTDGSPVTLAGASYDSATGVWSATIASDTLIHSKTYTITADISGSSGAASDLRAPQTQQTVTVDTEVPTLDTPVIATDNKVNIAEVSSGFTISGGTTGLETGSQVTVTLNSQTYTVNTLADGTWSAAVFTLDAANLTDGESYTITVDANDAHGNPASQVLQDITIDKSAPVSTVVVDEVITALPTITGQTNESTVEVKLDLDGDDVYGEVGEGTYTVNVTDGHWSLDLATVNADGTSVPISYTDIIADTLGVQVTTTDDSGNTMVNTEVATKQDSSYSISDARIIEGETGSKTMTFIVTREGDLSTTGSVDYAVDTTLSSAKEGGTPDDIDDDYSGTGSGTVNFAQGESVKEITFTVNGDYFKEVNQKIIVELSNPTGGLVSKGTGVGEISEIDVSQSTVAYSLQDINADLVTNSIRVRRSLDDAEMDIGFDKYGNLDTDALLQFVNNNDTGAAVNGATGYVTAWYDQSGSDSNMTQSNKAQQGVIVHHGGLVTHAEGSGKEGQVGISFNNDLNGDTSSTSANSEDDLMTISSPFTSNFEAEYVEIVAGYSVPAAQTDKAGTLFNLGTGSDKGRVSVFSPNNGLKDISWDTSDWRSPHRMEAEVTFTKDAYIELSVVFNGDNDATTAGSVNARDTEKAIYLNGIVHLFGEDPELETVTVSADTWYFANIGPDNKRPQSIIVDQFIVTVSDNAPTAISEFQGSDINNSFTYAGEATLTSINGAGGYDTVALSGIGTNLDATALTLTGIELIYMQNGEANQLTINDTQLTVNGTLLTVLMDTGDSVVYEGNTINHSATQEAITFGTTGNDVISMSNLNELTYGRGGNDTFVYQAWSDAATSSNDTITDFTVGTGNDVLNLSALLDGETSSNITDYITFGNDGTNTTLTIDINGDGSGTDLVIALTNTGVTTLNDLLTDGNIIIG